ncbi:hypothetical protein BDV23DRAFT_154984 [Aspergillus alliaceus]|uniref:Uncharacterized protein n=1 Tax=Petromyces alliaceus TaxID=209559 RepID=A0A5N7C933_PETAA|nr:uncharacterized protein BDW43DRAFT_259369 [Aspergillus alliaceus]KAB8239829.1 hypothetical protein BDW43DRAFT_259369 [Aspergillus alliaceus]KAE8390632.1 hypothetical protein BDV23DRAFT_154984 [Aspergillus alliaceus]
MGNNLPREARRIPQPDYLSDQFILSLIITTITTLYTIVTGQPFPSRYEQPPS